MTTFTIEPGASNLVVPKTGPLTLRNKGSYDAYYDREGTGFDNMLRPGQAYMVQTPTVFVVMANAKGPAELEVLP